MKIYKKKMIKINTYIELEAKSYIRDYKQYKANNYSK